MAGRLWFSLVAVVVALPSAGLGQGYPAPVVPPPIPDGPPLTDLPVSRPRPTWLEDGDGVRPAGATESEVPNWRNDTWPPAPAGPYASACTFGCADPNFQPGATSTQFLVGAYFSSGLGPSIKSCHYVPVTVRHGWMLTAPGESAWPGNLEFLADATAGAVISDYGNWLVGSSIYLRYNLVEPGSCIVPYSQIGAGFLLNDGYRDNSQRALGQMFEFHLHGEVGLKYFIAHNLTLDVEAGVQHISNANRADRNFGVNALGAQVGFTYYFPWGQQ